MGFVAWVIMGLIAAAIAKSVLDFEGGWLATAVLAVAGSTVAGLMAALLTGNSDLPFFSLPSWILAVLGCMLVLWVYKKVTDTRR